MVSFPTFSFGKNEKSIMDGIERHLSIVLDCVTQFQGYVSSIATHAAPADGVVDRISRLEEDADSVQRNIDEKVSQGAFFGGIREDILNLVSRDDDIADAAKDAAKMLLIGSEGDPAALQILSDESMSKFLENLRASVLCLQELIHSLRVSRKEVVCRVHNVEELEEAADVHKDALLKKLFALPRTADAVSVIQMRDLIYVADNIADMAQDAAEVVLLLVAKGYG